jgi:hypothetical protein
LKPAFRAFQVNRGQLEAPPGAKMRDPTTELACAASGILSNLLKLTGARA